MKTNITIIKLQKIYRRVKHNLIEEFELRDLTTELNLENSDVITERAAADNLYSYIKLKYMSATLDHIIKRITIDRTKRLKFKSNLIILKEFNFIGMEDACERQDLKSELAYSNEIVQISKEILKINPFYQETYNIDVETNNKLKKKLEKFEIRQNVIIFGSIFLGIAGVIAIASYILSKKDKKD